MKNKRKSKSPDFSAILAAVGAPAAFSFAIDAASKRVTFVAENYMAVKSATAGVLGAAMVYLGKDDMTKAAGYGLLGVAGSTGASKLSTMMTSSTPVNGTRRRTEILKRLEQMKQEAAGMNGTSSVVPMNGTSSVVPMGNVWGRMAMADSIYK